MSENDYIEKLRKSNPKLLGVYHAHEKLTMTPEEFEKQIKMAFQKGIEVGKSSKSVFEQLFGR